MKTIPQKVKQCGNTNNIKFEMHIIIPKQSWGNNSEKYNQ